MASSTNPLPLIPPPAPPRPSTASKSSILAHLPAECRPKLESLTYLLMNIDNDDFFDKEERQRLRNSNVGNEISTIITNCRDPRDQALATIKQYQESPNNESNDSYERLLEMNLLQLQTCALRASCPSRLYNFEQCWTRTIRAARATGGMQRQQQLEIPKHACRLERQALERCAGNLVERSVREAIMDDDSDDIVA